MKPKFVYILLTVIIVSGLFLRFSRLRTNFIFGRDQSEDIYKLVSIYDSFKSNDLKSLPLIGEPATYLLNQELEYGNYPVYTGVFFLYLLLPVAILTSFSPYGIVVFFASVNLISIYIMFRLGKELGDNTTGIISASMFSTSYFMNVYSRAIWTPSLIPVLVVFALYLLVLIKNKNRLKLWPLLLFVVSAMSQIHASGYYYMGLFIVWMLILRPKAPETLVNKLVSSFAFVLPLSPTIIYEFTTGFGFVPNLVKAFEFQFSNPNIDIFNITTGVFSKLWQFLVSIYPDFYKLPTPFLWVLSMVALSLVGIVPTLRGIPKKLSVAFFLSFFTIPYVVSVYYGDTYFGLKPLFGTTFSVLGAMPILILFYSLSLGYMFNKHLALKFLVVIIVLTVCASNVLTVKKAILDNGEHKFNFSEKLDIVNFIGKDAAGIKYDLIFENIQNEGQEFFYLFDYANYPKPVSFNSMTVMSTAFHEYVFTQGKSQVAYLIVDRIGPVVSNLDSAFKIEFQTNEYDIYKKHY